MSVLKYYDFITLCIRILGSLVCNIGFISDLCLVLCCEIYRDTLISIMYPACMIAVHDRKSRALQQPLYSRWEQSYLSPCAGPGEVSNLSCERRHCSLYHLLVSLRVLRVRLTLQSSCKGNLATTTSTPYSWGNQRGALLQYPQGKIS